MNKIHHWRVVPASVPGTSHEKRGQPCQDAHYWSRLPDGVLIAAVADGAGSAPFGEVGSAIAVQTAVELIGTQAAQLTANGQIINWDSLIRETLQTVQNAIAAEAQTRDVAVRDLATTLILAIATPQFVAVAQIGDGAAVIQDAEGQLIALTCPQQGEYANETTFLISPDALNSAQIALWTGTATHIALFSDGLQRLALKLPEGTPHLPFFSPLFRFVTDMQDELSAKQELVTFLRNPRITERTDDDLTILLATLIGD